MKLLLNKTLLIITCFATLLSCSATTFASAAWNKLQKTTITVSGQYYDSNQAFESPIKNFSSIKLGPQGVYADPMVGKSLYQVSYSCKKLDGSKQPLVDLNSLALGFGEANHGWTELTADEVSNADNTVTLTNIVGTYYSGEHDGQSNSVTLNGPITCLASD